MLHLIVDLYLQRQMDIHLKCFFYFGYALTVEDT